MKCTYFSGLFIGRVNQKQLVQGLTALAAQLGVELTVKGVVAVSTRISPKLFNALITRLSDLPLPAGPSSTRVWKCLLCLLRREARDCFVWQLVNLDEATVRKCRNFGETSLLLLTKALHKLHPDLHLGMRLTEEQLEQLRSAATAVAEVPSGLPETAKGQMGELHSTC